MELDENYVVRSADSPQGKVFFFLPSKMALGAYHDILLAEKWWAIEKMGAVQKEEEANSKKHNEQAAEPLEEAEVVKPEGE